MAVRCLRKMCLILNAHFRIATDLIGNSEVSEQTLCENFDDVKNTGDENLKTDGKAISDVTLDSKITVTIESQDVLAKEAICVEEKDIDEKEVEEVDLERPEKGEGEDEKEYFEDKEEQKCDQETESYMELQGDDENDVYYDDRNVLRLRNPPRVPFQTPVKTSPSESSFQTDGPDGFVERSNQRPQMLQHQSLSFELQPEVLERKLSRYNVESSPDSTHSEDKICTVKGSQYWYLWSCLFL